jgi:hypothetical protein
VRITHRIFHITEARGPKQAGVMRL